MFDVMFSWVVNQGSVNSDKGEGSSSGKSIDEAQVVLDQINLDAMKLEGSGKSGSPKISSHESTKGLSEIFRVFHTLVLESEYYWVSSYFSLNFGWF